MPSRIASIDCYTGKGPAMSILPQLSDRGFSIRKKSAQGITATNGQLIITPAIPGALTAGTAAHLGRIDIGDSDPLAIAKADAIAVNAMRAFRRLGIRRTRTSQIAATSARARQT